MPRLSSLPVYGPKSYDKQMGHKPSAGTLPGFAEHFRLFGNKPFMRFARRLGISKQALSLRMTDQPEADLGGGVFKFRLARSGEGKSGGARSIVAMKVGQRAVMMFGFEPKDLTNIDGRELREFRKLAKVYLERTEDEMDPLGNSGRVDRDQEQREAGRNGRRWRMKN